MNTVLKTHRSAVSSQKIILLGLAFRFSTALLITAMLGRFMTPAEYGFFSLISMLTLISKDLLELGASNLVTREIVRNPDKEQVLIEGLIAWRSVASTVIAVALIVFAFSLENTIQFYLILGLAIITPSYIALAQVPVFQARQAIMAPTFLGLGLQTLFIIALLTLQYTGFGGILLCWLILIREFLNNLGYHLLSRNLLSFRPGIGKLDSETRKFLGKALIFSGAILLHGLYFHSDVLLVYWLRGQAELGAYAASFRAINTALDLPYMLMMPLVPILSVAAASKIRFRELSSNIAILSLAIGLVGMVAGILTARDILQILYGEKYITGIYNSEHAFAWQSVALSATCLSAPLAIALLATNRESALLKIAAMGFFINIGANLVLIPAYGFTAAAMTTAITESFVCLLMLGTFFRSVGISVDRWGLAIPLPAIATGFAIAAIDLDPIPRFSIACVVGLIALMAILGSPVARRTRKLTEEDAEKTTQPDNGISATSA